MPSGLWASIGFCRAATAAAAVLALALLVAAAIARPPPDFSAAPAAAVLRDAGGNPIWTIRLAPASHLIAADVVRPEPPGRVYRLWLATADGGRPRWLGLLPRSGRKRLAVTPENMRLLAAGAGELIVTAETEGGASAHQPSGPALFRGLLEDSESRPRRSGFERKHRRRQLRSLRLAGKTAHVDACLGGSRPPRLRRFVAAVR